MRIPRHRVLRILKKLFSPKVLDGLTVPAEGLTSTCTAAPNIGRILIAVLARRRRRSLYLCSKRTSPITAVIILVLP